MGLCLDPVIGVRWCSADLYPSHRSPRLAIPAMMQPVRGHAVHQGSSCSHRVLAGSHRSNRSIAIISDRSTHTHGGTPQPLARRMVSCRGVEHEAVNFLSGEGGNPLSSMSA